MPKEKDTLFQTPSNTPFTFNDAVATAFDDMAERSIPFYHALQNSIVDLCRPYTQSPNAIIDLGCSTGTTLDNIIKNLSIDTKRIIGIDNSAPMLKKAAKKLEETPDIQLQEHDLNTPITLPKSDVVILNFVLQFIKKDTRPTLLKEIATKLSPEGSLILNEKITLPIPQHQTLFESTYHQFKANNGYSPAEITHKKTALKTVLIPLTLSENIQLLKDAGFTKVTPYFQWMNFAGILANK